MKTKKLLIVASFAFLSLSLGSCKKIWTCSCTYGGLTSSSNTDTKVSKSDAQTDCTNSETALKIVYSNASCTLK